MTATSHDVSSPVAGSGASGWGDFAGLSAGETATIIAGELGVEPHVPYLAWLPERGPGGDAVGRTAAMVSAVSGQFAVTTTPAGWRLTSGDPVEMRRGRSWLGEDLDALEEKFEGSIRPMVLTVVGPWSLAASLELVTGHRLVRDHAAVLDLTHALAAAVAEHVADVRRRLPTVTPLVRIDEPLLGPVLAGSIATPSGLDRYRSIAESVAAERLGLVVAAADPRLTVLRSTAAPLPLAVLTSAGAGGLSFDLDSIDLARDGDVIGEHIDRGGWLMVGVAVDSSTGPREKAVTGAATALTRWWHNLGFESERLSERVGLTPHSAAQPTTNPVAEFTILRSLSARLRDTSSPEEVHDD